MCSKKEKYGLKNKCSIMNSMLILLATSILLSSCAGMKSVRNGNVVAYKNGKKVIIERNNNESSKNVNQDIAEFEKLILENKDIKKSEVDELPIEGKNKVNESNLALPSINDQLAGLKNDQENSKKRIERVEDRLDKIEKILASLQSDIDLLIDKNKDIPATGAHNINQSEKVFTFKPDNSNKNNKRELANLAEDETFIDEEPQKIVKKVSQSPKKHIKQVNSSNNITQKNNVKNEPSQNIQIQQGINEYKKGNFKEAIKLLNLAKSNETSKKSQSDISYYLAESYFKSGDYQNSMSNYATVIQNNNSSFVAESQMKIAESNLRLGKLNDAKLAYQKLIASFPDSQYVPIARKMLQQL